MGYKAGKIALGFGLITGALTGLLFAPDEGKNLRKKIAKGDARGLLKDLESMGEEMKDMAVDFVKSPTVQEALDSAKDKVSDVANIKREELDKMLHKANVKANQFKKTVAKYVKEQKAMLDERMAKKHGKKAGKKSTSKHSAKPSKSAKKSSAKSSNSAKRNSKKK